VQVGANEVVPGPTEGSDGAAIEAVGDGEVRGDGVGEVGAMARSESVVLARSWV
jgi:hypothetical protein